MAKIHTYKWSDLPKAIDGVKTDSDKLQNKVHAVACSILLGWAQDRNKGQEAASLLTQLQTNTPWHGRSLATWIGLVSGMNWSDEKECWFVHTDQKFTKEKLDYAKANPFWTVSPPPKAKPMVLLDDIQKLIDRAAKRLEKPKTDEDQIDAATLRALRSVLESAKNGSEVVDTRTQDADH